MAFICAAARVFIFFPIIFRPYDFLNFFFIPLQKKFGEGYTGISLSVGRWVGGRSGKRSLRKILSGQLLLQFESNSLDTWQKCSLGAVDVQDANFVKIPSRITELLLLI